MRIGVAPDGDGIWTGQWIRFEEMTPNPATKRWAVMSKDQGSQIGMIKWHGPWRKYCFFPMAETVFEEKCLRDISDFGETQTRLHREAKSPNSKLSDGGGL